MQQISSRWTFFYKKIYPPLWYFLLASLAGRLIYSDISFRAKLVVLLMCMGFSFLGEFIFWKTVRGVVDRVDRDGTDLVVTQHGQSRRYSLSEVESMDYNRWTNPASVTLRLKERPVDFFPRSIKFLVPVSWVPLRKNRAVVQLIAEVQRLSSRESL